MVDLSTVASSSCRLVSEKVLGCFSAARYMRFLTAVGRTPWLSSILSMSDDCMLAKLRKKYYICGMILGVPRREAEIKPLELDAVDTVERKSYDTDN